MPAPPSRIALCHIEDDAKSAHEIRALIEMGRPDASFVDLDAAELVLLLCTPASIRAEALHGAAQDAHGRALPAIPIVAGGVAVDEIPFPATVKWGLELEDQMFAIKLLIAMNKQTEPL